MAWRGGFVFGSRAMLSAIRSLPVTGLARRHWPTTLVLAALLGLYLVAGLNLMGVTEIESRAVARVAPDLPRALSEVAPPAPEPLEFRHVDPDDAVAFNASIPLVDGPNPAARPFDQRSHSSADYQRALECLANAIYYEAATESLDGQRAVAQVVLNRLRHPAFPNSVCGVVYQGSERATGCQFTFTCDGSLVRAPIAPYWQRAKKVAEEALAGKVYAPVGYATHYHTNWVVPYWSSTLSKVANVGTHIFYRWAGGWGKPAAFTDRHSGDEPALAAPARLAALTRPTQVAEGSTDALAAEAAAEKGEEAASVDSFQRAVLRRYEPASREGVATMLAAQTRNGASVPASYRWALTGAGADEAGQAPLGQSAPVKVEPPQPACLAGVKKAPAEGAPSQPLAC